MSTLRVETLETLDGTKSIAIADLAVSLTTVVDDLLSTSDTDALSANQGRVLKGLVDDKQDELVSATNIKTVAGNTLLGSGDVDLAVADITGLQDALDDKQDVLVSATNIKTVNGNSLLGSGDLVISGGGGATDHGALTGLADDDHTQYHTDARGDARYSALGHTHTASQISDSTTVGRAVLTAADAAAARTAIGAGTGNGDVTTSGTQTLTNKTLDLSANTVTVDGTDAVGFRGIPQNSQSAAYTLVLGDAGKHILHPSADTTARTFTIPANSSVAFPVGTAVTFINQNAGGVITIAIATDTMRLAGPGTTGSRTLAANGIATAVKVTSTEWIISGVGLT